MKQYQIQFGNPINLRDFSCAGGIYPITNCEQFVAGINSWSNNTQIVAIYDKDCCKQVAYAQLVKMKKNDLEIASYITHINIPFCEYSFELNQNLSMNGDASILKGIKLLQKVVNTKNYNY